MRQLLQELAWQRQLRRAPPGPLREYSSVAWPSRSLPATQAPILALDLETTGLNPKVDEILSVAWVRVTGARVQLDTAEQYVVRPEGDLNPDSVVIHGIGDDQASRGEPLAAVVERLLQRAGGQVLLAHHAPLDLGFVARACQRIYGAQVAFPCIDTLRIAQRRQQRRQLDSAPPRDLSLSAQRALFGLPAYPQHHALWDAIAVAELWLALRADMAGRGELPLGSVMSLSPPARWLG